MTDPKLLQLTPEDKSDYLEKIKKVDVNQKNIILQIVRPKIESMVKEGNLNSVEIILIDDIEKLIGILELYPDLPTNMVKMILFAFTYFIDENDEIPDSIADYGYLDDIKVVEWVLNDVRDQVPYMPRA